MDYKFDINEFKQQCIKNYCKGRKKDPSTMINLILDGKYNDTHFHTGDEEENLKILISVIDSICESIPKIEFDKNPVIQYLVELNSTVTNIIIWDMCVHEHLNDGVDRIEYVVRSDFSNTKKILYAYSAYNDSFYDYMGQEILIRNTLLHKEIKQLKEELNLAKSEKYKFYEFELNKLFISEIKNIILDYLNE